MADAPIFPVIAFMAAIGAALVGTRMASGGAKGGSASVKAVKSSGNSSAMDASKVGKAQNFMQCALDQAAQAETASSRSCYGNRDSRLAASAQAQCHADAALSWAEMAESTAYNLSGPAQDAAARARDAANRAQQSANRARYNAETCTR